LSFKTAAADGVISSHTAQRMGGMEWGIFLPSAH
jgi:hypothetical protein